MPSRQLSERLVTSGRSQRVLVYESYLQPSCDSRFNGDSGKEVGLLRLSATEIPVSNLIGVCLLDNTDNLANASLL